MKLLLKNAGPHIVDVLELVLSNLWENKFEVDVEDIEEDIYIHDTRESSAYQGMVLYVKNFQKQSIYHSGRQGCFDNYSKRKLCYPQFEK